MFTNILIAIAYFIVKAMSLFMSCDKMIGGQFEKGLAAMKSIVETAAKQHESLVT